MTRTTEKHRGYPFAVVKTDTGLAAGGLQFPSMATAATMEELEPLLAEQAALYLLECKLEGCIPEPPEAEEQLDLRDYLEEGAEPEIIYVEPAPMSVVSIAIETARREEGISYAELARRMDVPRSVVTRITNPFYFGHTSRTLRSVADALGREVHLSLDRPSARPKDDRVPPLPAV